MSDKIKSLFTPLKPSLTAGYSAAPPPKPATPAVSPAQGTATNKPGPALTAACDVLITLRLVAELPRGEPVQIRSALGKNGERVIQLSLNASHLMVSRSLKRSDTLIVRFLLCMALAEYTGFWANRRDGRAVKAALVQATGLQSERGGIALASSLAATEFLRALDVIPIFGPDPSDQTHQLVTLPGVPLLVMSDIPNWRARQASTTGGN
jgi:hypothetical protein